MNGREKYFNTINFDELSVQWSHGPVVRGRTYRWTKLGCNWVPAPACLLPFFFSFIVFLPFGFLLSILTADPVNFARFLRKCISNFVAREARGTRENRKQSAIWPWS